MALDPFLFDFDMICPSETNTGFLNLADSIIHDYTMFCVKKDKLEQ